MKNDLSVSSPLQQYRRWPCQSLCSGRERGPLLSQRPGLKVSMDLWTYPMIIPQAVSCEGGGWGVAGWLRGRPFLDKKRRKTHWMMRERWEVKSLDWKAQIMRSACRSSVLKSIHTIHALGCQVLTATPDNPPDPRPYSDSFLHCRPFWLSVINFH